MAKKIDLQTIEIEHIIVHDIPKHAKGNQEILPNYSENESNITDGLRAFFKHKVVQALGSDKSFKICYDNNKSSPISWLNEEILASNGKKIVEHSKTITKHLFEIQVGTNAAGILVVITGKVNGMPVCIILKLERDNGAQLKLDPNTKSYNIQEVYDLMLTQRTKIFKVALFIQRKDFLVKFDGLIMDYQIDVKSKKEVTTWFIDRFLGCIAFEDPKITTQHFYNYTRAFIQTIDDEIDKIKYIQDLNSYIQKNSTTLNPREFADDYFKTTKHKNDYNKYLENKNFRFNAFPKDTSQIDRYIQKIIIIFENDISIIGNKGTLKNNVKLSRLENGKVRAEITSKIKNIK
jgi:hypothetical protein